VPGSKKGSEEKVCLRGKEKVEGKQSSRSQNGKNGGKRTPSRGGMPIGKTLDPQPAVLQDPKGQKGGKREGGARRSVGKPATYQSMSGGTVCGWRKEKGGRILWETTSD